jgi:predicted phosphodiesterase
MAHLGRLTIVHASLMHPTAYVSYPHQARAQLELLSRNHPESAILALGHTHLPWLFHHRRGTLAIRPEAWIDLQRAGRYLVNPGSVGQSRVREREPRVRFAQIDPDGWRIRYWALDYDHGSTRRDLRATGQPDAAVHLRPSWMTVALRPIRGRLSQLRHGDLPT